MTSVMYNALKDLGAGNIAIAFVFISLFIDFTPIVKINPVRSLFNALGSAFNKSIDSKIDDLRKDMNEQVNDLSDNINKRMDHIEDEIKRLESNQGDLLERELELARAEDEAVIDNLKQHILSFSNRLSKHEKFTTEEYRTVMDNYKKYHQLIDKYDDLENGKIDVEYNIIVEHYKKNKDCGDYMF